MSEAMTAAPTAEQAKAAAARGLGPVQRNYTLAKIEVREPDVATGGDIAFKGHASVTGRAYPMCGGADDGGWDETIVPGAFKKTLNERADVAFLLNHGGMTLARTKSGTLKLAEDKTGLAVDASLSANNSVVRDMADALSRNDLDEMSFAFKVVKDEWLNRDGEEVPWWDMSGVTRNIREVSLAKGDVSVVNYGASPFTDAGLRSVDARAFVTGLRELRAGATLSNVTLTTLHQVLDLISGADDNLDDAQEVLAALMGVPNPDMDEADEAMSGELSLKVAPSYYANLATLLDKKALVDA